MSLISRIFVNKLRVLFVLVAIGCQGGGDRYEASVYEIRANPGKYENNEVIVRGYLSRVLWSNSGPLYLYATRDDASMRNVASGVMLDRPLDGYNDEFNSCIENFVKVMGAYREIKNEAIGRELAITDIKVIYQIGLDESSKISNDIKLCYESKESM